MGKNLVKKWLQTSKYSNGVTQCHGFFSCEFMKVFARVRKNEKDKTSKFSDWAYLIFAFSLWKYLTLFLNYSSVESFGIKLIWSQLSQIFILISSSFISVAVNIAFLMRFRKNFLIHRFNECRMKNGVVTYKF